MSKFWNWATAVAFAVIFAATIAGHAYAGDCQVSFTENYAQSVAAIKADPEKYKGLRSYLYEGERAKAFQAAVEDIAHEHAEFSAEVVAVFVKSDTTLPAGDDTETAFIFWGVDGCIVASTSGVPGTVITMVQRKLGEERL